jgi:hypothetical protein
MTPRRDGVKSEISNTSATALSSFDAEIKHTGHPKWCDRIIADLDSADAHDKTESHWAPLFSRL